MEVGKPSLVGMTREELTESLAPRPDAKLRAKQLALHLYARAEDDFSAMNDLPAAFRTELSEKFLSQPLQVAAHKTSTDGVDKLLTHRGDHQVYECVLLPFEKTKDSSKRVSSCLSSQVGCAMGCKFCATGLGGFDRNLSAGEIVGQYLMLQRLSKDRISHVVFMGMGEPLLNLPNVLKAVRLLHDEVGLSYRNITISTVGIVPQIYELAKADLPINLALSLHSPLDDVRNRLMPVNHKWPVAEVMKAMHDYYSTTGRQITLEYLLIKGITDTEDQAEELARIVKGVPSLVNLIPFNWVDTEQGFARPEKERVQAFRSVLERRRVNVTQRRERGHDIAAACGQLAGEHKGRFGAGKRSLAVVQ